MTRKKKICKECGKEKYLFGHGLCENCYNIAQWKKSEKKKSAKRTNSKKSRKRSSKTTYWKNKAWKMFSRYVRARDASASGVVVCCTCGRRMTWQGKGNCHAGHYISRRYLGTFLDERNVHGQCAYCNKFRHGAESDYETFLKLKYGDQVIEELKIKSKAKVKRSWLDWKAFADFYKEEGDMMIQVKGLIEK